MTTHMQKIKEKWNESYARAKNINNENLKTLFGQFRDYVIEYQLTNRKYYLDKCDYSMLADNYVNMIKGNSLKRERY